jgi:hypothetical protein
MKIKFFAIIPVLFIPCLIAACSSTTGSSSTSPFSGMQLATLTDKTGVPAATTAVAATQPASGTVLFSDDFSNPDSGWQVSEDEYGKAGYENGAYVVEADKNQYTMWGTASKNFTNVKIDVDAHVTNTADNADNAFGVDCRVQSNGDGYSFHISSDGYYSIIKFQDLKAVPLVDWTQSSDVPTGDQVIHLTALCQGDHLQFWVNNVSVADIQDSTFSSGDLSLSAATMSDNQKAIVAYTNYVVTNPDSQSNLAGTKLTIDNPTDQEVCAVFVVDPASQTWGKNRLPESGTLAAGASAQIDISALGTYDVEAEGCDYYKLLVVYKLDLTQDQTLTLQQPQALASWDFKKANSAWSTDTLKNGTATLTNDDYLSLTANASNALLELPAAGFTATDAIVRSDVMLVKPSDSQEAIFGAMCRVQADGSGILFAVRSDGSASIQKVTAGQLTPLLDWVQSSFVLKGIDSNVIEGECNGSEFSMYVNGDFIGKVQDTTYSGGQVALAVKSTGAPTQVDFDYLKVYPIQK